MRVVSLLPAATEWLAAFGAADLLVGRSHACTAPPEVQSLPVVTRLAQPVRGSATEIDAAVWAAVAEGRSLYALDEALLWELRPDLVITQEQCGVCAASPRDLAAVLPQGVEVFSFSPITLKQALDAALTLGRRVGRLQEAMEVIGEGERRLQVLRARLGARRDGTLAAGPPPRVACIEWTDPLMTAGHWAPDLVRLAGGEPVCAEGGEPSRYVSWDALAAADPDVLVVAACGRDVQQGGEDVAALAGAAAWEGLRAVREGRVFVLDGAAYLNSPGLRLYRTIELLAAALHPERAGITPRPSEMLLLTEGVPA